MRALLTACLILSLSPPAHADPHAKTKLRFDFLYATGWGTRISTYDSTLTKDLVLDPDTTVHFVMSRADLDSVRQKMVEIHFFRIKEPHPDFHFGDTITTIQPSTTIQMEATLGTETRRLFWSTANGVPNEGDWKGLGELNALIWRIIRRQPAYQAPPHPRGNYL